MSELSVNSQPDSANPLRWIPIGDLVEDPKFADLCKLAVDNDPQGARRSDPLVVWPQDGGLLVLLGYAQLPLLRTLAAPVLVMEENFANRADATVFVVSYLLKAYRLTSVCQSYLRGTAYNIASAYYDNSQSSLPTSIFEAVERALAKRTVAEERRGGVKRPRAGKRRPGKTRRGEQ